MTFPGAEHPALKSIQAITEFSMAIWELYKYTVIIHDHWW